jgi:glycosyltransferase involved in cell wall biosynthesis
MTTQAPNRVDISVVIPVFNGLGTIAQAVDSALEQTYAPLEVIVVDDGSTDGTGNLVKSRYGGRVRYLYQLNKGVSFARNHGAETTSGSWLAFLDCDDVWLANKLEEQVKELQERPECDVVLSEVDFVDVNNRLVRTSRRNADCSSRRNYLNSIMKNPMLLPSTMLVKRDKFFEFGKFDESLVTAEDLDTHLRLAVSCDIWVVDKPLVRYLKSERGLSALKRTYGDYVHVIERFVAGHPDWLTRKTASDALVRAHLSAQKGYVLHGDHRAALKSFGRAVKRCRRMTDAVHVFKMGIYCTKLASVAALRSRSISESRFKGLRHQ